MTFVMGNESAVNLKECKTIDNLREEIDSLLDDVWRLRDDIKSKVKMLDEMTGINPHDLLSLRKEAVNSKIDYSDNYEIREEAERDIAESHIFLLIEQYGDYDEDRTDKMEADIAAAKLLRGEL